MQQTTCLRDVMCVYRPKETTSSISLIIVNTRPKRNCNTSNILVWTLAHGKLNSVDHCAACHHVNYSKCIVMCDVILKKVPVPVQLALVTRTIKTLLGCHFNYVNLTKNRTNKNSILNYNSVQDYCLLGCDIM